FPNLSSPSDGMQAAKKGVTQAGGTVRITTQQRSGNRILYTGTTSWRKAGGTEWLGFFAPTESGVVGMFVGTAKGYFQQNQAMVQDIISSIHVAGESNQTATSEEPNE